MFKKFLKTKKEEQKENLFSVCLSCFSLMKRDSLGNRDIEDEDDIDEISSLLTSCSDCLERHLKIYEFEFFNN